MKRLYFLLGLCLLSIPSFATLVTVNATGATGSFKTGYTQATTGRTDGDMVIDATLTIKRGYAVFNLAGLVPAGATVTNVSVRFNFSTTTLGAGVACTIRGFAGDLSTVTAPATLYADCASGATYNATNWGVSLTGSQDNLPFSGAGITFIQSNLGSPVSICFVTTSGANVYTIVGEGGTAATQPQLQITYSCPGVTAVSASAAPITLCEGSTLTLTGAATGATSYSWAGPSSFSSTDETTSLTTGPAASGVYTFTAFNAAGCATTATTANVTVNPDAAIAGTFQICTGTTTTLSDATAGTWSCTPASVASITSLGVVTGSTPGTATITHTTAAGCTATATVTVDQSPSPITGTGSICVNTTTALSESSTGGVWSSSNSAQASVNTLFGLVHGLSGGTPTISYTIGVCSALMTISVNAAPATITGTLSACPGTTTTLADASGGGTWTSSNTGVATVGSATGIVYGSVPGSASITYSNGCGADVSASVVINQLPSGIHGQAVICNGSTATLTDSTASGTWSASPLTIATVGSGSGIVTGVSLGTAVISYTALTSCYSTYVVTVNAPPSPIGGPVPSRVCTGHAITLTESSVGGVWSSGNTSYATVSSGGIVTGISFGVTDITYTAGPGCFLVHTVSVNPVAPILGTDSVCVGLSTFLTNIVGGGAWTSSSFAIATVVHDSGRVVGIAPGTTTITYILGTGCQSSVTFQVIAFPDAIAGIAKACPGTTTGLSDPTPGGAWSSSNNSVATVAAANGIVGGVFGDTVTISYSILPGCAVNTIVTINPLPALITGPGLVCPQTVDSLHDASPGGLWSSATPVIATVIDTSGVVFTKAEGSAIIKYTLSTGCFRTRTISVFPLPAPTVTYNWVDNTFYTTILPQYVSYQWYDSVQGLIPGATSPTIAALNTEYYFVVVTDTNGCRGASDLIPYNTGTLGAGNTTATNGIAIYPNPVSGTLYIQSAVKMRAVISSIDGKKQLEQDDAREIDVTALPGAIYLISLFDEKGNELSTQKLIKK